MSHAEEHGYDHGGDPSPTSPATKSRRRRIAGARSQSDGCRNEDGVRARDGTNGRGAVAQGVVPVVVIEGTVDVLDVDGQGMNPLEATQAAVVVGPGAGEAATEIMTVKMGTRRNIPCSQT